MKNPIIQDYNETISNSNKYSLMDKFNDDFNMTEEENLIFNNNSFSNQNFSKNNLSNTLKKKSYKNSLKENSKYSISYRINFKNLNQ